MKPALGISRREFVKAAGVALAGAALPLQGAVLVTHLIGCYTRCFDAFDFKTALDGIAAAGYKHVGIMTAKGPSWAIITPETTLDHAAQLADEVKRRGLKTLSVYADFGAEAARSEREAVLALQKRIQICQRFESPHLLLGGAADEKIAKNYYKAVAECCPAAREAAIILSIKPHGGLNSTGPQCRKLVEGVSDPNFRLWYDPGNIFYYSAGALDPVEDSKTVNGIISGMSVKDFLPPKDVVVTPGTGKVDFPKVLANLRAGGFKSGPLVVECVKRGELSVVTAEARKARLFIESLVAAQ